MVWKVLATCFPRLGKFISVRVGSQAPLRRGPGGPHRSAAKGCTENAGSATISARRRGLTRLALSSLKHAEDLHDDCVREYPSDPQDKVAHPLTDAACQFAPYVSVTARRFSASNTPKCEQVAQNSPTSSHWGTVLANHYRSLTSPDKRTVYLASFSKRLIHFKFPLLAIRVLNQTRHLITQRIRTSGALVRGPHLRRGINWFLLNAINYGIL